MKMEIEDDLNDLAPSSYKKQSLTKEKEDQLLKDFEPYNIPLEVKKRAAKIYIMVLAGDTFKRGRRKAMMCKCAYEAFKENGIAKDPILLARVFDINAKKLREAQDEFYTRIFGTELLKQFPKRHLSAKELLIDIGTFLGATNLPIDDLGILIDKMYEDSIFMNRTSPRDVAITVVFWYLNVQKKNVSSTEVQKTTLIARAKLNKILSIIQQIIPQ